jgi:hypothetical protein
MQWVRKQEFVERAEALDVISLIAIKEHAGGTNG